MLEAHAIEATTAGKNAFWGPPSLATSGEQIREVVERQPHLRKGVSVSFDAGLSIHQIKRALGAHERSQDRIECLCWKHRKQRYARHGRHRFSRFDHFNPTSHETKGFRRAVTDMVTGQFPVDIYLKDVDASNAAPKTDNLKKT